MIIAALPREDGEDPPADATGAHAGQIEVAARPAVAELGVVLACEGVVVPVEDGDHET